MKKLFGTDGIRSAYGQYPLTENELIKLGEATGRFLSSKDTPATILIGKDTRYSGDEIEKLFIKGLSQNKINIILLGTIPTPALSCFVRKYNARLAAMISASHNLSEDNGIKFFDSRGMKVSDETEEKIEKLFFDADYISDGRQRGNVVTQSNEEVVLDYVKFLKDTFEGEDLKGIKIVADCAHGAVYEVVEKLYGGLGADIISINNEPDGSNINLNCGSQHPEAAARAVLDNKVHVGLSFDGDGDRVILVDEKGQVLDGDFIMTMAALDLHEHKRLNKDTLVATVMSNMGLDEALSEYGIRVLRTGVGDKQVVNKLIADKLNLGGEQSGHIVFFDYSPTGDGPLTALQILSLMKKKNKYLSELGLCMEKFPQVLLNIKVSEKKEFSKIPQLASKLKAIEDELGDEGRIFLRYSGTEPLARLMIEAKDENLINRFGHEVAELIKKDIGV